MSIRDQLVLAICFLSVAILPNRAHAQSNDHSFVWSHDPARELVFQRGSFRHFVLSETAPEDVELKVEPSSDALFGQLRFGNEDSRRITLMFDEAEDEVLLYADMNRDRILEMSELVAADEQQKNHWVIETTSEVSNESALLERAIEIRLVDGFMLAASLGHLSGKVDLNGQKLNARRIDGNADGLLTSKSDRLWIDLNADNVWDPLTEQFLNSPVVLIGNRRFKLSTTPSGSQLELKELTGIGSIELKLKNRSLARKLSSIEVTLTEQSGMYFSISDFKKPLEAPAGNYRLHSIVCTTRAKQDEESLTFSFYNHEPKDEWMKLDDEQKLVVDPFGEMKFFVETLDVSRIPVIQDNLAVQPKLVTGTGLLITSCHRGDDPNDHVLAETRFEIPDEWDEVTNSGFA